VPISVNWATKVISVPQSYLTLVSGNLYELDTDQFRKDLKALEAAADGMAFEDTHRHSAATTLGGVTYARQIEIINGYTVTFGDGQYRVRFVGSNNNISDVTNLNQVSLLPQNSAGLIAVSVPTAAQIAAAVLDKALADHQLAGSAGRALKQVLQTAVNRLEVDIAAQELVLYDDAGQNVIQRWHLMTTDGEAVKTYKGTQTKRSGPL
jgi:hypothetical protein